MADIYVLWLFGCSWAITPLINQRLSLPPASCLHPLASRFPPRWQPVGGGQDAVLWWPPPPDVRVRSHAALGAAVDGRMRQYLCKRSKLDHAVYPPPPTPPSLKVCGCSPIQPWASPATCSIKQAIVYSCHAGCSVRTMHTAIAFRRCGLMCTLRLASLCH